MCGIVGCLVQFSIAQRAVFVDHSRMAWPPGRGHAKQRFDGVARPVPGPAIFVGAYRGKRDETIQCGVAADDAVVVDLG